MIPRAKPNLSTPTLLRWATGVATTVYKVDFNHYATQMKNIRPYFTPTGYASFTTDFKKRLLPEIIKKRLIVSSVVTGAPVVLREGLIISGSYAWEIQFPMIITYESQSDIRHSNVVVTLSIVQVPTVESPLGIGISSFITSGK